MRSLRAALFATAAMLAAPAHAGSEVLSAPAPGWVEVAEMAAVLAKSGPPDLLYDWQYRLEDGVVTTYLDQATRLENPQSLMQNGTLSFDWMPDKGDLTIHKLEIHRGGEVIDLAARGARFEVLRREQGLEQRLLDGALTATLAVPGLREGDVLRVAHSISLDDQALGDEVQAAQLLPADPWQVGTARAIVSWPADEEMYWQAEERVALGEPERRGGDYVLSVDLPLARRPEMPADAPFRYRRPEVLRVGSFASWNELSAVMQPHFARAAAVASGSDVAAQARAIMARTDDPVERMALATRLVQDEVSYLLNGLEGGNYLPQSAEDTWDKRYGDCKAKSVLLQALLQQMGIASEPVLVTTQGGDAVPELLPLPLAFNHVIVHAALGGTDYWLDGTSTATRTSNIADVPAFSWALPLRQGGSDLMAMAQREPAAPQMQVGLTLDHSAGIDLPVLFEMQMRILGPGGAPLRAMADAGDPSVLRQLASSFAGNGGMEDAVVSDVTLTYDNEAAVATLTLTGVAGPMFEWRDGRMVMDDVASGPDAPGFNPDRARAAWRGIPVAVPGPARQSFAMRLILPDGGKGFALDGVPEFAGGFGHYRSQSRVRLEGGEVLGETEVFLLPGEIAPADLGEARRAARRLESRSLGLKTPAGATWRWDHDAAERRRRAAPVLAAYAAAIAFAEPEDYSPLQWRALFHKNIYDHEAALADFNRLVEQMPSPWAYQQRASVHEALGARAAAIADLQAAWELDAANGTAIALARLLAYDGRASEAQELLDSLPVGEEEQLTWADMQATLAALAGDKAGGLSLLADEVTDKPQNADVLNADCWYRGLFNVALESALARCTQAVERAAFSAPALDSRALVRYRLGMLAEARSDLDAALAVSPGLAPSMYLRGIVRLEAGDRAGRDDIAAALRIAPNLTEYYARHGIDVPG